MVAHRDRGREARTSRVMGSDPAEREAQAAQRRSRALEEPLDVRPRGEAPFPELEVRNPVRQTRYRILLPAWPSRESAMCVCTDFARRGLGTCKHLEAAWNWLALHPGPLPVRADVGPSVAWAEVDQARRALLRGVTLPTLRRAGEVLFLRE